MICIDLSFFFSLSFFSPFLLLLLRPVSFFLFSVCTTHTLTLRINVQKNDEYVTTAFIWLLLARFFSSSSLFDIFSFFSACWCCSCLIDIICCLRREERILLLVRRTALFLFFALFLF